MSYQTQAALTGDPDWIGRCFAAATEQANGYRNDARPDWVALAEAVQRGESDKLSTFVRLDAAAPGVGDQVDNGDGTIDQAKVADAELLSATQAVWQVIAPLYYDPEGNPIP
jgi:hypothetical protein